MDLDARDGGLRKNFGKSIPGHLGASSGVTMTPNLFLRTETEGNKGGHGKPDICVTVTYARNSDARMQSIRGGSGDSFATAGEGSSLDADGGGAAQGQAAFRAIFLSADANSGSRPRGARAGDSSCAGGVLQ